MQSLDRSIRVSVAFVACLVAALFVAGCGGDPKVEYQRDLSAVGATVKTALAKLPRDEQTTVTPQQVHVLADQLRSAAGDLDDLDPPTDATEVAQRQLHTGLVGVADAFDGLADDLDDAVDDDARAELFVSFASNTKIDHAFTDISDAQVAYDAQGMSVFARGGPPVALENTTKR